jgi:HTH-type transcriptional regulator/antitoxin HigA
MSTLITVKPIKTEQDYEQALARIRQIFHAPEGSPEADELEVLTTLIEAYEDEHHAIDELPDPVEAVKLRMEELGLKDKDLIPLIGSKTTVSLVLNRKREFTAHMMYNLHKRLHIPIEVFFSSYSYA